MTEREPLARLEAKQQYLNQVIGQREALTERLGPDSIDFQNATPREVRVFGIKSRVRSSIDHLKDSLSGIHAQVDAYLPGIAKNHRLEILREERGLRSIELSQSRGVNIPDEVLAGIRLQLEKLRDKPQKDPILARALRLEEQKPAPTPPAEVVSEEEKQRRQAILETIGSFDNLTILERKSLLKGVIYSKDSPGSNKDWAELMEYGKNVTEFDAVGRLQTIRARALKKVSPKIELGDIRIGREVAHYLILTEPPIEEGAKPEEENLPEVLLDGKSLTLSVNGNPIKIGNAEFIILKHLIEAKGQPLSPKTLNDALEEEDYSRSVSNFRITINKKAERELVKQLGSRREGFFQYVLPRKLSEEEQKPETPKKEFGKEPVTEVVLNLLNKMIDNPQMSFEQAVELRGLMANGRKFNKWALIKSLQSAVSVLMTRTRKEKLTETERSIVDSLHSIFKGEAVKDSLKTFRGNIYQWLNEGTPIIPVSEPKDEGKTKKHQESRQMFEVTFDGKQIKVMGRLTAVSLQTLADTSPENKIKLADLAMALYGKDDQEAMSKTRDIIRMYNIRSFSELNLEAVIEGGKNQSTVYLKRHDKQQPKTEEIIQLEQSLQNLLDSRSPIEEAINLGLPGDYGTDLERLNQLIEQKKAQLDKLKQA